MITCKELPNHVFESKTDMFQALVENMPSILTLKKDAFKEADTFSYSVIEAIKDDEVVKANKPVMNSDKTELKVKVVMNTTGLLDSHGDVHIKDIWKRTLSQSNNKIHLQEHKKEFDKVIAYDSNAYVSNLAWKTLGANFEGTTQALIFESTVKEGQNKEMFKAYRDANVTNHSVGMRYVDTRYCINSEEDWAKDYKSNWDKYYPMVANKEDADARGYFMAVLEAKLVEGSAVLFGSNSITPTIDNNMKSELDSPSKIEEEETTKEPEETTPETPQEEQKRTLNLNVI